MIDDPAANRIRFEGGRLQLFGVDPAAAADLQHRHGGSGRRHRLAGARHQLLDAQRARARGALLLADRAQPRPDAHAAPLHRRRCPRSKARYRELNRLGAFQIGGFVTYGTDRRSRPRRPTPDTRQRLPRLFRGQRQGPARSRCGASPASLRVATDKTVTRRYDITRDDRLRNFVNAERITPEQLYQHRRLGVPGPARRRRPEADPDRACRRSMPASGSTRRSSAARSSCRPTASRSCASTARTRSAPSPARAGTCAG